MIQGCPAKDGEYLDCAISTYEDAMVTLAALRPDKWEVTKRGMRAR